MSGPGTTTQPAPATGGPGTADVSPAPPNGDTGTQARHEPPAVELSDTDARAAAQAAWRADPELTGAQLGARFNKGERWGRKQIAAAKAANGTDNGTTDRRNGTPAQQPAARAGTPATARRPATGTATTAAAARQRRTGTARPEPEHVPGLLVAATVVAVLVVTAVCAVVSYVHVRDLAVSAGMGSLASWLPLGVDGLVVASSCSLIVDRHLARPVEPLAVIGVALGLAGSLGANVLAVDPTLVSLRAVRWVLAGYSPAALAVSGHLLFRMLGQHRTHPSSSPSSRERR